ncbi:MAG: DUF1768 domain-containing protein [Methylococcaceae bacterium]|nr:DUF1768 domain-containing protein [Methylococcaceae bacterium]
MNISNRLQLIDYLSQGNQAKYLFFWGHTPAKGDNVDKSCFSQWYEQGFDIDGIHYRTAEHFMMAEKARLFHDDKVLDKVLNAKHPHEAKKLGRQVENFKENIWQQHHFDIVVTANFAKFSQHSALKEFLLNTQQRILVEASPVDKIWGIGLAADHLDAGNPYKWQGSNLLGFALMEVRHRLS